MIIEGKPYEVVTQEVAWLVVCPLCQAGAGQSCKYETGEEYRGIHLQRHATAYHLTQPKSSGGTMSEEQVLPDPKTVERLSHYQPASHDYIGVVREFDYDKLLASLAQSEAERERLQGENIKLLNDASVWRNRAIGAEEELREGGRGIDLRRGFER